MTSGSVPVRVYSRQPITMISPRRSLRHLADKSGFRLFDGNREVQ